MLRRKSEGEGNGIPFPSPSFFLCGVLFVAYAPAEIIIFLSADIPRNRLAASLARFLKRFLYTVLTLHKLILFSAVEI